MDYFKGLMSEIKVSVIGYTGNLAFHAAVTRPGFLKANTRENGFDARNAGMS
jgi:hypothetical protein